MKPAIIFAIIIPIIIAVAFSVFLISSFKEENPQDVPENQRNEIAWQLLQKTYLEQECREKFIGQSEELEKCFDIIEEEQRLNPPTIP
ncbi:MAG TPA: hypothetical protein VIS47_04700 [Nitrosopumilus sp.]